MEERSWFDSEDVEDIGDRSVMEKLMGLRNTHSHSIQAMDLSHAFAQPARTRINRNREKSHLLRPTSSPYPSYPSFPSSSFSSSPPSSPSPPSSSSPSPPITPPDSPPLSPLSSSLPSSSSSSSSLPSLLSNSSLPEGKYFLRSNNHLSASWFVRHTLSYWVAVFFLLGSILFTTGSGLWIVDWQHEYQVDSYVNVPFAVGALFFTFGCTSAYVETILVLGARWSDGSGGFDEANKDDPSAPVDFFEWENNFWVRVRCYISSHSWQTVCSFLVGSLLFNVNTIGGFVSAKLSEEYAQTKIILDWITAVCGVVGGFLFFTGGALEWWMNKGWIWRPRKLSWWVAMFNFIGGITFFEAPVVVLVAQCGAPVSDTVILYLVKVTYVFGCFSYFCGSLTALLMWKLQQHGNAYMLWLNLDVPGLRKEATVQVSQLPYMVMYSLTVCIAIVGLSLAINCDPFQIKDFAFAVLVSFGVLFLGSEIHRVPEEIPYSYLMWFLRIIVGFYLIILALNASQVCSAQDSDFN